MLNQSKREITFDTQLKTALVALHLHGRSLLFFFVSRFL